MSWKHYGGSVPRMETNDELRLTSGGILARSPFIFDHFAYGAGAFNSHVPQNWVTTETGAATPFAPGATGGTYATGVTGGTTNNAQELAGKGVLWVPSTMGGVVLEVRAKFVGATTETDGDFRIALHDAVTETNGLAYVVSATSTLTTHAPTDAVGFTYSSIPTSGALYSASGNYVGIVNSIADTDTVTATTTVKDSSFHVYRIEIDTSGNARHFIDNTHVGTVASAVTASVALTPYISAIAKNSHAVTATVDYVYVAAGSYL
jgi:hypothetical protein